MTAKKNIVEKFCAIGLAAILTLTVSACGDPVPETKKSPAPVADVTHDLFNADLTGARVLVFSKTGGWRHDSIPAGIAALEKLAQTHKFSVVATEDSALFTDASLREFNAVVFLNTSLNVLEEDQEFAMERFIQAGGGFVGIHAAADTEWEGNWHWYRNLVGAVFKSHPNEPSNVQKARLNVLDHEHSATDELPETFELIDEWYDYRDLYPLRKDLLTVDEKTYMGGTQGDYHPITWYHDYDGGRSFYTGLGHTKEMFSNEHFLALLTKGLRYAVGGKPALDYTKVRPENNRFVKKSLINNLDEPMSFDFFPNGDAIIAERPGKLKLVSHATGETATVGEVEVAYHASDEIGLIGVAVHYEFAKNPWIYLAYNHQDESGQRWQRLSRFNWTDNKLDNTSEKILLSHKIDSNCCHTGGDLEWGHNGELFISTGDNTNPHDQNGFSPIDFRADATRNDALRGAGNTQDFRGKVLRIIPQADGTYTIPEGNLFSDPNEGRPEIYVMGARNPFTIAFDKDTSALYYGDVGPDANESSKERGTRGHDEYNRVLSAANMGWPLFTGNNQPYVEYDFETGKSGRMFNPLSPQNNSPRNTGAKQLPPAQPALIWYPYGVSEEFPELGSGGRMAVVADLYRTKNYPAGKNRYPEYYDGKLFILEAMRGWIKAVSFDEQGRIIKIEPFTPQLSYTLPTDARFSPDGTLHVLEYGRAWFTGNPDASLTRVEFIGAGNRAPEPAITVAARQGSAPMTVHASAAESIDPDGDSLTYRWSLVRPGQQPEELGTDAEVEASLTDEGTYQLRLTAIDPSGETTTTEVNIDVGNAPATIAVDLKGNTSFYWPDTRALEYAVTVTDVEDGVVTATEGDKSLVHVGFKFNGVEASAPAAGHQSAGLEIIGKELVAANACTACHQIDELSVGPAYRTVADRYKSDATALKYLATKIGTGGNGVWGENNMPGFSHLSEDDRTALAAYVLSLATEVKPASLPLTGKFNFAKHAFSAEHLVGADLPRKLPDEHYEISVSYTDKGSATVGPIAVTKTIRLNPARFGVRNLLKSDNEAFAADRFSLRAESGTGQWRLLPIGSYDLTSVKSLQLGHIISEVDARWDIEIRVGSADGEVVAKGVAGGKEAYQRLPLTVTQMQGHQLLYIAARATNQPASEIHLIDLSFHK